MHPLTKMRRDVNQCIEREARDAAVQLFIEARLCHAAMLCRFKLRPAILLNQRRDFFISSERSCRLPTAARVSVVASHTLT